MSFPAKSILSAFEHIRSKFTNVVEDATAALEWPRWCFINGRIRQIPGGARSKTDNGQVQFPGTLRLAVPHKVRKEETRKRRDLFQANFIFLVKDFIMATSFPAKPIL